MGVFFISALYNTIKVLNSSCRVAYIIPEKTKRRSAQWSGNKKAFGPKQKRGAIMRISTKGRHAVIAMLDFARYGQGKPVPLADVAERQKISLSYLEQLVSKLKKNGLVKSMRGPGGGYLLLAAPANITIQQIVTAVDVATTHDKIPEGDAATARQLTDALWNHFSNDLYHGMKRITLGDVLARKISSTGR